MQQPSKTKEGSRHGATSLRGLSRQRTAAAIIQKAEDNVPAEPVAEKQSDRFGRIFPASSYSPTDAAIHQLAETMKETNSSAGDNPGLAAGFTFLAQFIDHDLTLDITGLFSQLQDPAAVVDFRTPNLDLDNLYGAGPGVDRYLYDVSGSYGQNPVKLLLDAGRDFDLPRNSQHTAVIGDLRNDENFIISQTHLIFIKFHNAVVDYLLNNNPGVYSGAHGNSQLFKDASALVRWHYQWIILHEFLPLLLGPDMVQNILQNGTKLYNWTTIAQYPFMPVEFSIAAYRLGHTLLREAYIINDTISSSLFDLPVFGNQPIKDISGKLDFKKFFDFMGYIPAQRARKIDARICLPVFSLPFIDPVQDPPISLPERNMLRAKMFQLPSGQQVARYMKELGLPVTIYTNQELGIDQIEGLNGEAPLWFYILKESEFPPGNSLYLGPVGGRIIGEYLISVLRDIKGNQLHDDPTWLPTLPGNRKDEFSMTDMLNFAEA